MKWSDIPPFLWFPIAGFAFMLLVLLFQSNRSKRLRERLEMMAREMGWSEVTFSRFFVMGVRGMWNGYPVRIRLFPRQKSTPERIAANIRVQAPARLAITRRQRGVFSGRPLTLFGPPLIDLPLYQQFWIRSDEITLPERLMRSSAAAMLDRILQSRYDILRLGRDDLFVQRISAREPDEVARLAREELELLRATIDALSLRP
ncbi:MAG TPA: hypothetical protein VF219_18300 [Vicinamibacterales bacterium]